VRILLEFQAYIELWILTASLGTWPSTCFQCFNARPLVGFSFVRQHSGAKLSLKILHWHTLCCCGVLNLKATVCHKCVFRPPPRRDDAQYVFHICCGLSYSTYVWFVGWNSGFPHPCLCTLTLTTFRLNEGFPNDPGPAQLLFVHPKMALA